MEKIWIPQEDVNSQGANIISWLIEDGVFVKSGDLICEVETTKAIFEVLSPGEGYLVHLHETGAFVEYNQPVAFLSGDKKEIQTIKSMLKQEKKAPSKITKKALQLSQQLGIDTTAIELEGIITEKHILQMVREQPNQKSVIMEPGLSPKGLKRILVLGGGYGAMQVIDILLHDPNVKIVGILDDNHDLHGVEIFGVKVHGSTDLIESLFKENQFDQAIVSISNNIEVRKRLFMRCKQLNINMINAICPTVRINREVHIGEGNVICSMVHIGTCTSIGDNNFISSHCSIEHHNSWGSNNTTGPGCMTSSRVRFGNGIKLGTGVFIQPGIGIGDNCRIASGAILTRTVTGNHAVKSRFDYEVKPIKEK